METISLPILNESTIQSIVERTVLRVLEAQKQIIKRDETLITTQEVCDEFRVTRVTLSNYQRTGKLLPYGKAGKQHTYKRCDCQDAFRHKMYALKKESANSPQ
ncbi:MAG: helix-turn-helix domain-containing protein [Sporocytophaga sp.]|nr:helix-turn-helix domain-containing protein [Sporocytophaga sp.]